LKNTFYYTVFKTIALLVFALLVVPNALAVTFTVNSTLDQPDDLTMPGTCHTAANTCTLRAAVMQANRTSGAGATIMVPSGIYTLTIPAAGADGEENGDLNLTTPASGSPVITIIGAGAGTTIIDANQLDRVFHVHPDRKTTISGVTIRNGFIAGANASGGGIYNEQGSLTVSNAVISGNHCDFLGGGIYNNVGFVTVMNSTLSLNNAGGIGGGILNNGSLTVIDSTLSQNNGGNGGGGIYNVKTLKVSNSAIYGNGAINGGGIYSGGGLTVINSTLSQNNATNSGGGIYNYSDSADVYNSSIVFNSGLGGVYNNNTLATFNLRNTLVAGNNRASTPTPLYKDCSGTLNSYGRNLFWDVIDCTINNAAGGSWTTLNLLQTLGPLQNNGGPTWTHALLPGSNAIDGGDPVQGCVGTDSLLLTTDQRGAARVAGVRCDIGAVEFGALLPQLFLPLVVK
jgi:hypothetical protein